MADKYSEKKLNNKGLSLVELLVAISILVIVITPVMHSFITSARTNARAKTIHKATSVAQNIMEGINAMGIEELACEFNWPVRANDSGVDENQFHILPLDQLQYSLTNSVGEAYEESGVFHKALQISLTDYEGLAPDQRYKAAAAYSNDRGNTYEFIRDEKGMYLFYIRNIVMENSVFDARITLDGSAYEDGGSSGKSYNSDKIVQIPTIDTTYDALEVRAEEYNAVALAEFALNNHGETFSKENLRRTIIITVTDDILLDETIYTKVSTKYYYEHPLSTGTWVNLSYEPAPIFDNAGHTADRALRNIYLFYSPLYSSITGNITDKIQINNSTNRDVNIYIIKTEDSDLASDLSKRAEINIKEQSYAAEVNIMEPPTNPPFTSHVTIHTNLGTNLTDIYESPRPVPPDNTKYYLNGVDVSDISKTVFGVSSLMNEHSKDRMFDVTVEIFSGTTYRSETEFSAAGIVFEDRNRLVTITGTKCD